MMSTSTPGNDRRNIPDRIMLNCGHWIRTVYALGAMACTLYLIVVYVLPLAGFIEQPTVPSKLLVEILVCGMPISAGVVLACLETLVKSISASVQDEFLVVRLGDRLIAMCCLEITSAPGSVECGPDDKPKYNTAMLLALRAGMDHRVTMAYEAGLAKSEPFLRFFISMTGRQLEEMMQILRREATRTEAILLASLVNLELHQLRGDALGKAVTSIVDEGMPESGLHRETDFQKSLIVFTGTPRVAPSPSSSQIGTFLSTALKQGFCLSLTCVFSSAKSGRERRKMEGQWRSIRERERKREDSLVDQAAKKHLLDQYEQVQGNEGWFNSTVYVVVSASSATQLRTAREGVTGLAISVWGGDSRVLVRDMRVGTGMAWKLLTRRHFKPQKLHVGRLAAFVNTPVQSVPVVSAIQTPSFPVPARELVDNELFIGWTVYGGRQLNKVGLRKEWLREHVAVMGATGTGKTTLVKHLMAELTLKTDVPWWIFDVKGSEYSDLVDIDDEVMVLRPGLDPSFAIDMMDPEVDTGERHAYTTFAILRELLKEMGTSVELSPAMEKLLRESVLKVAGENRRGNSVHALIDTINELAGNDRTGTLTRDALLNRLEILSREPLGPILSGGPNAVRMSALLDRRVIFDLRYVARVGGMDAARLLYNLVAKRIFDGAMRRGITPELVHVVVLEEASNLVPESYTRQSAADVTTGESMVMLQRATGQGVIVVSTRPNVSSNILANTSTKITFRLPYDSSVGGRFMSLNEEQERYLRTLKVGRALIVTPQTETFEIVTTRFSVTPQSRLSPEDQVSDVTDSVADRRSDEHSDVERCPVFPERVSEPAGTELDVSEEKVHQGPVFDRLGELANRVVAFLASQSAATNDELKHFLTTLDSQIRSEDTTELIHDLICLGTIERESLPLVCGGFLFTLPGKGSEAVKEAITQYILRALGKNPTSEKTSTDEPDIVIEDKAVMIIPEHLKASSIESTLDWIQHRMNYLGNEIAELYVVVRGSVAAARLRELMDASEDFDSVTVVSAFPSSLDSMVEAQLQRRKKHDGGQDKAGIVGIADRPVDRHLRNVMHEQIPSSAFAVQTRLWFGTIQDFVELSGGQVRWNTLLDFIQTTAIQSVRSRSIPMSEDEGKRALTDLLVDGKLIALRVKDKEVFQDLEEGLWTVSCSKIVELREKAVAALEAELVKSSDRVLRNHGHYNLCANRKSYIVFPSQQELNVLLQSVSGTVCSICRSTQTVCVLTAVEYLNEDAVKPPNLVAYEFEEAQAVIGSEEK